MPVDSGGNPSRPPSPIPVDGQTAQAAEVNVPVNDIYSILALFPFLDGRKSWRGNQNLNGYKFGNAANAVAPQEYVTLAQMQEAIAAVSFIFPGFVQVDTATSSVAPPGWLYANGQEVSRTTYAALWQRISTGPGNNLAATQAAKTHGQYGPGNGSTTFTLPNLYGSNADGGYFIRSIAPGRGIGSVQLDENKQHTHVATLSQSGRHKHNVPAVFNAAWESQSNNRSRISYGPTYSGSINETFTNMDETGEHTHTADVQNSGGTESRPKNIAYPVLIKA